MSRKLQTKKTINFVEGEGSDEDSDYNIQTLNKDKEKLIEYITQKDKAIKDLEKEYTEVLDNIPADQCGDVKPSKELLNYFRKAYNK